MKMRYLIIAAVIALAFGLARMGANRNEAVKAAEAIIVKDQAGETVTADVARLKEFASEHMRASVTFELKASYDRAVSKARADAQPKIDPDLYTKAQQACATARDATAQTRCVSNYVAANSSSKPKQLVLPSKAKYSFSFNSPAWTLDQAGISLLLALVLFALSAWLGIFRVLERRKTA